MSEKYSGLVGRFHLWKEGVKQRWQGVKEEGGVESVIKNTSGRVKEDLINKINKGDGDYDHLFRRKSRWELTRISAAVMGIEFSYAAETAFVSPTLLKIGVLHEHMTLIWCLSPLVGFFLTPIMGSMSDGCRSRLGRRRPFIILLSIGVILGLIMVPNGKFLGKQLGDRYPGEEALERAEQLDREQQKWESEHQGPGGRLYAYGQDDEETKIIKTLEGTDAEGNSTMAEKLGLSVEGNHRSHPWGILFTVLGTVLLDFDADACQSPSRAYLLDVTLPDDHAVGLSTFTIMAGLGGSLGYAMGGLNWGWLAVLFGGHVRLVFSLVLVIFVACVTVTLTSFAEIPLKKMEASREQIKAKRRRSSMYYQKFVVDDDGARDVHHMEELPEQTYGSFEEASHECQDTHVKGNPFVKDTTSPSSQQTSEEKNIIQMSETIFTQASPVPVEPSGAGTSAHMTTLSQYLWSIIYMPNSLRVLCLTNLFCWMSLVCYSLYFTDFVGEAVFQGDPQADAGTEKRKLYDQGVQFGCWGMAMYSLSCSCYSFIIERLVQRFRAKPVYICGQLVYCVGMIFMALTRSQWGVLLFSWAAGVMYSTLFTMPYLLVAHYHEIDAVYSQDPKQCSQIRGLGTDVGIVSSMVFLAQFILSLSMGTIIAAAQSTVAVILAAAVLSFCGAITASFVTYHQL